MAKATGNDWTTLSYNPVGDTDAEVVQIIRPVNTMDTCPFVPKARIRNNSSVSLDIPVVFTIFKRFTGRPDSLFYFDSLTVNLPGDSTYDVSFDTCNITGDDTGRYLAEATVSVLGDQNRNNDSKTRYFHVIYFFWPPPIWEAMAPIPPGLSLRNPKSGSCITELNNKLYFLKASNTQDFHVYSRDTMVDEQGTWTSDTMPLGIVENGDGKKPKNGAAITSYQPEGSIYVLRGNNTVGFWKYQADTTGGRTIGWTKMKNIPVGLRRPKEAAGMASFQQQGEGYIFTMKGSRTDEFYIYSISGDTWHRVSSPPPGQSGRIGYRNGSCLTYDGNQYMYVLKGNYGDLFRYSVDGDSWHELRRYDYRIFLNREGRKKKVNDGAGLVYYDNNIYLLKGSNTTEFWRYEIASDTWVQMGPRLNWDIQLGEGRKVKGGGCMTMGGYYFAVVKGANTSEFYRHALPYPSLALVSVQPLIDGTQENKSLTNSFKLVIAPNPSNNVIKINYNLPIKSPVNIKLFDATGALVKSFEQKNEINHGSVMIDAKSLPAGVYLLRFSTLDTKITRKLVIEK